MSRTTTLVKNAFANVCRGGAAALVMVLLPPFLTRILSKDAYGTWLLILQLSTYVSLLDFGIQTAVGRYVAHHNELEEPEKRDSIISTSLALLAGSGALAMVGISILAWQLPNLFKDMPTALHQDAQLALMCVGGSLAVALPFSVFGGIFIGLQRYDIPAWIIGVSKLLGGVFVVLIANTSHSIVMMAIVMGVTNIGSGLWQFLAYRRIAIDIRISKQRISKSSAKEISLYCFGLSIWTLAMILITGFDTAIVGYFDYKSVVYYSIAATLTNFLIGIQSSITNAIIPLASAIGAKKDSESLGYLLASGTKYSVISMILIGLPFILWGRSILTLWVGDTYASSTITLLQLLLVGNFIRQIGAVYSTIVLAIGEQSLIIASPLIEGMTNLTMSILITYHFGYLGVAIGTMCGALIGIFLHFYYNLPRTTKIKISSENLSVNSVLTPLFSVLPTILFLLLDNQINFSRPIYFACSIVCILVSWSLLWIIGLSRLERRKIIAYFPKLISIS
jgi:O-antigen/teichoic acid export membrane protein